MLLSGIVFICFIVAIYFILGVYEFYQRVRVFKINMKAWNYVRNDNPENDGIRQKTKSIFVSN